MATGSRSTGTPALSSVQLEEVLKNVKDGMLDEVASLKRELAGDREAADECLLKKRKLEKAPSFKKKMHEKQYHFNEEVSLKLEAAAASLSEIPPAMEKAKAQLEEGLKLVCERQKLIRLADRSEHGWATVEEYLEDELADNSDDEKRMQKAEFRAGRKLKAAAAKTAKKKAGFLQKRPGQVSTKYHAPPPSGPAPQCSLSGTVPALSAQHIAAGYLVYGKWPGVTVGWVLIASIY
jgi:uncharacterized protein YeaO (DUF488 family)